MRAPTGGQLLAHLAGDYLLQSDWMAQEKTSRHGPALAHALVYALPFTALTRSPARLAVIAGSHFAIDRWRLARHLCWAKNNLAGSRKSPEMTEHPEIPVKVTAWVDEAVAPLVIALNAAPGILTLDSCQEDPADGLARVTFCTHANDELPATVDALTTKTADLDGVTVTLWHGEDKSALVADLTCPPPLIPVVAVRVRSAAPMAERTAAEPPAGIQPAVG